MPTNRTRLARHSQGLDHWKIDQLVVGWPMIAGVGYSAGFPDGCNHWSDAEWHEFRARMHADWVNIGPAFMAWWRGETEQFSAAYSQLQPMRPDPSVTPWAYGEWGLPAD